ncbi:MAG TPA: HprK-related kinase A [Rubrivivax sp.]|nr:HprK-related kinase A [Rubrivivax sp.]
MSAQPPRRRLDDCDLRELASRLRAGRLWLDFGATSTRLASDVPALAEHLRQVYAQFPLLDDPGWADHHVRILRPRGLRRWLRPQAEFECDLQRPFEPFPADTALPLFEWGSNWLIGKRLANLLLLHAGVVERDGLALILPAVPGSGKSTLTAALSLRGWRLLSDEFGAFCPERRRFIAMLKPVALKNDSIDLIRAFEPQAPIGPLFPKTRKGTVAHLGADREAVDRRHEWVRPGAVVMPRWVGDSPLSLTPQPAHLVFGSLAFNAFNYQDNGERGFDAASYLATQCRGWRLEYSRLDDALAALERLWEEVREARAVKAAAESPA